MDDRILALCELSNDLAYAKIPSAKLEYYISNSLESGKKAAEKFQGSDIYGLYEENNIKINYQEKNPKFFGVLLRGTAVLSEKECSVTLSRESISELAAHSKWEGGTLIDDDTALRIHLAHEFYHYLEYKNGVTISSQLDPVETFHFKRLSRKVHIGRCEEIAAHSFAKNLLGLDVLPNYYDYLYLIDTGSMAQADFSAMLERNRKLLEQNAASPSAF